MRRLQLSARSELWRHWRWTVLVFGGLLVGFFDAAFLRKLGISFIVNSSDATWIVGAYFGISFAMLGWFGDLVLAARDREREASALIRSQAEALDAARRRLNETEKLASLGQLSAAIAHEVRNPLGVIRSAAQSLSEASGTSSDDARRAATFIISEADRLNAVVSSVLAFARPLQMQLRPASVGQIVDRAVLLVRDELVDKRVQVQAAETHALPELEVDPDLVTQALFSLLHNAVEAVGAGGAIQLAARHDSRMVTIEVTDSGPGVPNELRSRIFEPFFTTRSGGTGLGLAIVRQIVEAHRGAISVSNAIGGGACFTMQLPIATDAG